MAANEAFGGKQTFRLTFKEEFPKNQTADS